MSWSDPRCNKMIPDDFRKKSDSQSFPASLEKWLEELVSKSNTIQTQEDILVSGVIAGQYPVKLCVFL